MIDHVSEALLRRFTAGHLDEPVAVAIAEHIDACPLCATRAIAAEPLAHAFAAVDDPPIPPDLLDEVLTAVRAPAAPPAPAAELLASLSLLLAAALLLLTLDDPLSLLAELAVDVGALVAGLEGLRVGLEAAPLSVLLGLAVAALGLSGLAARQLGATPATLRRVA